jgi:hypothetical protein
MIEHDRERQLGEMVVQRLDDRELGVELDMPAQALDLFGRGIERGLGRIGIEPSAAALEVEADAANPMPAISSMPVRGVDSSMTAMPRARAPNRRTALTEQELSVP